MKPILNILSPRIDKAVIAFGDLHDKKDFDNSFLDIEKYYSVSDEIAGKIIIEVCCVDSPSDVAALDRDLLKNIFPVLYKNYNLSIRQMSRITGVSRGIISRLL